MSARIIDGKAIGAEVRREVGQGVVALAAETGARPGLATVLVGDDAASAVYVANKRKACAEVGIADHHRHLPGGVAQAEVASLLAELAADPEVNGILLQLPLPAHLDAAPLTASIPPEKDVDGLTPLSTGLLAKGEPGLRPCTPLGVIELLDRHGVILDSAEAVVVGRSDLVGKPLAALLLARNATVTVCHSRTRDLVAVCARAEVLVAAVGVARLLGAEHVRHGAAVIDVGMSRTGAGLQGDVDFDAVKDRAGLLTPVPGGVGPMTIAMLLRNTLQAARAQLPRR